LLTDLAFDSESHSLMAFDSESLKHSAFGSESHSHSVSRMDLEFDSESDSVYLILHQQ